MKCDELKAYTYDDMLDGNADVDIEYYPKSEVGAAIEELKRENRKLKRALWLARAESAKDAECRYHRLAQKEVCDPQPHGWSCYINGEVYPTGIMSRKLEPHYWCDIWSEVERKCRAKAEEYK